MVTLPPPARVQFVTKKSAGHNFKLPNFETYPPLVACSLFRSPVVLSTLPTRAQRVSNKTGYTMASSSPLGRLFDRKISVGALLKANDITLDVSDFRENFPSASVCYR